MSQSTKVLTLKVRASFCNVFKPKAAQEGATEKYSVQLIIDKDDEITLNRIEEAVEAAKQLGKTSKWSGKIPKKLKLPLRDGDEDREDDPNYEGKFFLNAASLTKPQIINREKDELTSPDEFYSGCYCRATLNFYPFNSNGNNGVAAGLGNLQFLEDGDPLGSVRTSAYDDFGEDEDEDLLA